jgi:Tfp pilus assembly protein PilX
MKLPAKSHRSEGGFILVATMVILLLLVIMGISATMTATMETEISGNEKAYKTNFYQTDGGVELGELLIEENLSCPGGFSQFPASSGYADIPHATPRVRVTNLAFAWSEILPTGVAWNDNDIYFPQDLVPSATTVGQTYLKVGGQTVYSAGASLQQAAGYMGKGKSAASGGAMVLSTMYAKRRGLANSLSEIKDGWRHVVGQEGSCRY